MVRKLLPTLQFEKKLWSKGYLVIGVDEVGRGSLAGPVGVGAICFKAVDEIKCNNIEKLGINDSKKLSVLQREKLKVSIGDHLLAKAITFSSVAYINKHGIVAAVNRAIRQAVKQIVSELGKDKPYFLLLDAFHVKNISGIGLQNQKAIIHGDSLSVSIAAASILAKIERDAVMIKLHQKNKAYNWKENKGYGTKQHILSIKKHGISILHRTLYIRNISTNGIVRRKIL